MRRKAYMGYAAYSVREEARSRSHQQKQRPFEAHSRKAKTRSKKKGMAEAIPFESFEPGLRGGIPACNY
jgi:hypothetical protein